MAKSIKFKEDFLKMVFHGNTIPNMTGNTLYMSLHTADPSSTAYQSTAEISYTGYARIAISRDLSGWSYSNGTMKLVGDRSFPMSTDGITYEATHLGIGTSANGEGYLLYSGALVPPISVANTSEPTITSNTVVTEG